MYKCSKYNIIVKRDNDLYLLYNTFKHGIVEIDEQCKTDLLSLNLESQYKQTFLDFGYWIDIDADELNEIKFLNRKVKFDNDSLFVTLKLTNACNFLYSYCYQEHKNAVLDDEKVRIFTRFIKNQVEDGKKNIQIHFFGGEPLLNISAINAITQFVKDAGIKCEFFMTSNGYLLTSETVETLNSVGLRSLQITLDGTKYYHDQTRTLEDGTGTFDVIVEGLQNVLSLSNMDIFIRYNITKQNAANIDDFLLFLKDKNILNERVTIIFCEAIDHTGNGNPEIFFADRKEYASASLQAYRVKLKYGLKINRRLFTGVSCTFDKINSFIVSPNLELEYCTSSEITTGRIDADGHVTYTHDMYKRVLRDPFETEKCIACKMLPSCLGGCALLEKLNTDFCPAEKYIMQDLIPLYHDSIIQGENNV